MPFYVYSIPFALYLYTTQTVYIICLFICAEKLQNLDLGLIIFCMYILSIIFLIFMIIGVIFPFSNLSFLRELLTEQLLPRCLPFNKSL